MVNITGRQYSFCAGAYWVLILEGFSLEFLWAHVLNNNYTTRQLEPILYEFCRKIDISSNMAAKQNASRKLHLLSYEAAAFNDIKDNISVEAAVT
jgi:hypothetical protein